MTTAEIHEMDQLEQTCEEVRRDNEMLRAHIAELRHTLGEIYKANCLGKTKKIADMIDATLYPHRRR
jgi:prefoldin subunit 5